MTTSITLISSMDLQLVKIPAGSFLMGSPTSELRRSLDEGPQHEVTLESFFLGRTQITQAQWREVAGWTEGPLERWGMDLSDKLEPSHFRGDNRPVESVNWFEAMEFCSRLSQRTGNYYTLPSEAQWEYACRAGTTTPFHFGETISPELANYDGNYSYGPGKNGKNRQQTTDVASFPANTWGLHDMHGNMWEWCLDDWHDNYTGAPTDGSPWLTEDDSLGKCFAAARGATTPMIAARHTAAGATRTPTAATLASASVTEAEAQSEGSVQYGRDRGVILKAGVRMERHQQAPAVPTIETLKVLRGGEWLIDPMLCRSASRDYYHPADTNGYVGFRVCCLPQD